MPSPMTRLRADAQENRDRILATAAELFAERGLQVGMREVARRAGVGPATLYRRFPTRQALVDEAFSAQVDACRRIVENGCAQADPWTGLTEALRGLLVLSVQNRAFVDALLTTMPPGALAQHRRELLGLLGGLAARARDAGRLRADFVSGDLVLVLSAGRGLAAGRRELLPAAAHRFADLAIDAFRAEPGPPR